MWEWNLGIIFLFVLYVLWKIIRNRRRVCGKGVDIKEKYLMGIKVIIIKVGEGIREFW